MNNADQTIERVLTGLREAEAPEGMDRRILIALDDRAAIVSPVRPAALAPRIWATAAVCVAVILFAICWSAFKPHPSNRNLATANPAPHAGAQDAHPSQITASVPEPPLHPRARPAAPSSDKTPRPAALTGSQETLPDTLAVSHPAPPLPLTPQEQALLRILHKGDPVELAMLNNDFGGRRAARDTEEFQRFFNIAPPEQPAEEQQKGKSQTATEQ